MSIENCANTEELRARDYIPVLGFLNYGLRNGDIIREGVDDIIVQRHVDRDEVKHVLERTLLLALYNGAVISSVVKMLK
ncbi:MAG: hypothetical protein AAB721_00300 [Patescibacteria group bacterium]